MNMDITTPLLSLEKKCFHTLYVNIIVDENSQKLANPFKSSFSLLLLYLT